MVFALKQLLAVLINFNMETFVLIVVQLELSKPVHNVLEVAPLKHITVAKSALLVAQVDF
jgi:hypothetical protein